MFVILFAMDSIPKEVVDKLSDFDEAMTAFENQSEEYFEKRQDYDQLSKLEQARTDLSALFAVNSLYWAYLHTKGKDPNECPEMTTELKRVKEYMAKLKQFDDLAKRPNYEPKTVKRFVRNSLFDVHAKGDNNGTGNTEATSSHIDI